MVRSHQPDPAKGVYSISMAAELAGMGVQNLRLYEQRGLLEPEWVHSSPRSLIDDDPARPDSQASPGPDGPLAGWAA